MIINLKANEYVEKGFERTFKENVDDEVGKRIHSDIRNYVSKSLMPYVTNYFRIVEVNGIIWYILEDIKYSYETPDGKIKNSYQVSWRKTTKGKNAGDVKITCRKILSEVGCVFVI